jgi:AcrR family transcriptional regulator
MNPRTYRRDKRQTATEETRTRIITAARELLSAEDGVAGFSIDAVAREAGVARMTVYYQFNSKRGLYEAISDDLAVRAEVGERIGSAFRHHDALDALDAFIGAFGHFWSTDRIVIRRLQGLGAIDPEIERGDRARNERRRKGLRNMLERLAAQYNLPPADRLGEMVDVLYAVTSFATFDDLAGSTRTPEEVVPVVQRIAHAVLGLRNR